MLIPDRVLQYPKLKLCDIGLETSDGQKLEKLPENKQWQLMGLGRVLVRT